MIIKYKKDALEIEFEGSVDDGLKLLQLIERPMFLIKNKDGEITKEAIKEFNNNWRDK